MADIDTIWRGAFDDDEVQRVHDAAFDIALRTPPAEWNRLTMRYSLGWVTARRGAELIGFLNVLTDGEVHAWLQDVVVAPSMHRNGVGKAMVDVAVEHARSAGCEWLHVDFDDDAADFYLNGCGFASSRAGLKAL